MGYNDHAAAKYHTTAIEREISIQAARHLYELQELDWNLAERERSLADVRAKLADDSELSSARARTDDLVSHLDDLTSRRRASDRTIADLQENLKKIDKRLYGGAVTNPREMAAAEEEHSFVSAQHREEEDGLLEIMVETEEVEASQVEARAALDRLEADRPAQVERLTREEEVLTRELAGLNEERAQFSPSVPPAMLSRYESLRKTRGGHAVARVERGMCQGCRVALPTMEVQRARGSEAIVQCSSCRRILYAV